MVNSHCWYKRRCTCDYSADDKDGKRGVDSQSSHATQLLPNNDDAVTATTTDATTTTTTATTTTTTTTTNTCTAATADAASVASRDRRKTKWSQSRQSTILDFDSHGQSELTISFVTLAIIRHWICSMLITVVHYMRVSCCSSHGGWGEGLHPNYFIICISQCCRSDVSDQKYQSKFAKCSKSQLYASSRLRNDLHCVECDVILFYAIPYAG